MIRAVQYSLLSLILPSLCLGNPSSTDECSSLESRLSVQLADGESGEEVIKITISSNNPKKLEVIEVNDDDGLISGLLLSQIAIEKDENELLEAKPLFKKYLDKSVEYLNYWKKNYPKDSRLQLSETKDVFSNLESLKKKLDKEPLRKEDIGNYVKKVVRPISSIGMIYSGRVIRNGGNYTDIEENTKIRKVIGEEVFNSLLQINSAGERNCKNIQVSSTDGHVPWSNLNRASLTEREMIRQLRVTPRKTRSVK